MLFGDKSKFAIECYVEQSKAPESLKYGSLSIWLDSEQVGDPTVQVSLITPVRFFEDSLKDCGNRKDEKLFRMGTSEVIEFLDAALWSNDETVISLSLSELEQLSEKYEKFNICTNFSEVFDGETVYLLEDESGERFIWKTFESKVVREVTLPHGTYELVIRAFIDWYLSL